MTGQDDDTKNTQTQLAGHGPVDRLVRRPVPKRAKKCAPVAEEPLIFTRADMASLAKFDPSTKLCTMNCGPHAKDPRTTAERKFLCDECVEDWNR